jgi:TonB-dependent SusC/RagA subfamily outer membrane receptor
MRFQDLTPGNSKKLTPLLAGKKNMNNLHPVFLISIFSLPLNGLKMKNILMIILALVIFFPNELLAQKPEKSFTVSGRVVDVNQKPVTGATIFIDKKKTSSVTNENGEYAIKVSSRAKEILVFTLIYGAVEQTIDGRTSIDFVVGGKPAENQQSKEPVPVKEARDRNVPDGVINGQDTKFINAVTIYDMIRGQVPGVEVSGTSIRIRGERSLNVSNEPIFVVDGVIVSSIEGISPRQVKSIKVLKGPDASIYGNRGSNGVIEITLMSGKDK